MSEAGQRTLASLRPYQRYGVRWLINRLRSPDGRAVLLCDDPGLGKTVQTLAAAHMLQAQRIVVVSPAGARRVWLGEIIKWFPAWVTRVVNIEPGDFPSVRDLDRPDAIALVSYDCLSHHGAPWAAAIRAREWDLLVVDEAHYLKNPSYRTIAVYGEKGDRSGIQARARHVILLTGTPTPNHAGELYQHCRALWPFALARPMALDTMMTEAEFQERFTRYKETRFGRQIVGSTNTTLLRDRLRPYVLHRTKRTVLPELPPLIIQDVMLNRSAKVVDSSLSPGLRTLTQQLDRLDDEALFRTLRSTPPDERAPLASLRRQLGEFKIDPAVEWIIERLDCGTRKIALFGWHVHVLHHLARRLAEYEPTIITGTTTPAQRETAVHRFQNHPDTRVFVGQILAAGTAITLTAASEVAIIEPSWVPGENTQAIGRAHRLGQHDSVLASFLTLPGTLDQRIMRIMRRKASETKDLYEESHDDERAGAVDGESVDPCQLRNAGRSVRSVAPAAG